MTNEIDRRRFFQGGVAATALLGFGGRGPRLERPLAAHPNFPQQDPARVREVVGASHGNFARVQELVNASPALAKASWDWGFGDWESALGAAAHTGNVDIAEYLIAHGARPNIFSAATLGQLEVVRALVEASPGVQSTPGPHGITLLSHAKSGGDAARPVVEYLERVGGADMRPTSVPLPDRGPYVGTYRFGPGESELIEIADDRETLWFARVETTRRAMTHVGGHAFFPAGAPAVRIRFSMTGNVATSLDIFDPDIMLSATRS